jgi:hypothetical protein
LGVGLITSPHKKQIVTRSEKQQPDGPKTALNGEEWRKLLKKARAHTGLLSQ